MAGADYRYIDSDGNNNKLLYVYYNIDILWCSHFALYSTVQPPADQRLTLAKWCIWVASR
jgi:hypothetical protein